VCAGGGPSSGAPSPALLSVQPVAPAAAGGDVLGASDGALFTHKAHHGAAIGQLHLANGQRRGNTGREAAELRCGYGPYSDFNCAAAAVDGHQSPGGGAGRRATRSSDNTTQCACADAAWCGSRCWPCVRTICCAGCASARSAGPSRGTDVYRQRAPCVEGVRFTSGARESESRDRRSRIRHDHRRLRLRQDRLTCACCSAWSGRHAARF
jgi:hypothetical protein